MRGIVSRPVARLLFATAGVVTIAVSFLRGNYLLGPACGVVYAAITLTLLWLLARSSTPGERPSRVRVGLVMALSVLMGYLMAFPASFNPDVQVFIDRQATDRTARAELAAVFRSDPTFAGLSVSSVPWKVVNVTVRGSLGTRSDLDRLRSRVAGECPAVHECVLHWDIVLRATGERVSGLDRELFAEDPITASFRDATAVDPLRR